MKRNIYFHENNSLERSYKRLKGHLSAVYLLPLIFVESTSKILSLSFLFPFYIFISIRNRGDVLTPFTP